MEESVQREGLTFGKKRDLFMLLLCVYILGQLALEVVLTVSPRVEAVLYWIDFGICLIFLFDWIYFFVVSRHKLQYCKTRWIDLLASIPFVQVLRPLRILRIARLIKTLRIMRGLKGAFPVMRVLFSNPARSALTVYIGLTAIVYFYCSVGIHTFEIEHNEAILNFGDVLWMSFTTLTSVGYGDIYPVTTGGRVMAAILVATGMGLFSLVTAEFAALILRYAKQDSSDNHDQ